MSGDSPCYSPDGKLLAYTNHMAVGPGMAGAGNKPRINIIDPANPNPIQQRSIGEGDMPVFSPNGKAILFNRTYSNAGKDVTMLAIYISRGGGQPGSVFEPKTEERTADEMMGGFSPDSKLIVFSCATGISVMKPDRSGVRQLTTNVKDTAPKFTSDGKQVVFLRDTDLYVMNADGSEQKALTKDVKVLSFTIVPGDKQVLFLSRPEDPPAPPANGPGAGAPGVK